MDPSAYTNAVRDWSAALAEAAREDIDAAVPSCPGWTVTDLVKHVGGVHGWAAAIVAAGSRQDFVPAPPGLAGDALVSWAEQQTIALLETLSAADPDAGVWTFGQPRTVRFWLRRQANETCLHAWDAQEAIGRAGPLPAALAADGLDEFLTSMVPRHLQRAPGSWTGETLHVHRTDGEGEWLLRLGPEVSVETKHGKGDVAVRGPAEGLLLWATNRRDATGLDVFGDASLLDRWRAEVRF